MFEKRIRKGRKSYLGNKDMVGTTLQNVAQSYRGGNTSMEETSRSTVFSKEFPGYQGQERTANNVSQKLGFSSAGHFLPVVLEVTVATTVMFPGLAAPWGKTEPLPIYSRVNLRETAWETRSSVDRKIIALNHSKLLLTQVFVFIMQETCEGKKRPEGK